MNTFPSFLVRWAFPVLLSAWIAPCNAQGTDGGLTSDFNKLSPKERSKIAAKETREAAADSGYQHLMQQADEAFRAGRYEDALSAFEKARTQRPYNVYPKVKIQDLQALIKRRDQELSEQRSAPAADPPGAAKIGTGTPLTPASSAADMDTAPAGPSLVGQQVLPPRPVENTPQPAARMTSPGIPPASSGSRAAPAPDAEEKPATLGERVYLEAGATVTERTVADEGRLVVYKKVVHPWGQTFHFKDGLAISEREWNERFNP